MTIAQTILSQLGGNKFRAMTGAKDMIDTGKGLLFALPRGAANKANKVQITLDASDTYTVQFFAIRGVNVREVSSTEFVYADKLREVFTAQTGLYTSL